MPRRSGVAHSAIGQDSRSPVHCMVPAAVLYAGSCICDTEQAQGLIAGHGLCTDQQDVWRVYRPVHAWQWPLNSPKQLLRMPTAWPTSCSHWGMLLQHCRPVRPWLWPLSSSRRRWATSRLQGRWLAPAGAAGLTCSCSRWEMLAHHVLSAVLQFSSSACVAKGRVAGAAGVGSSHKAPTLHSGLPSLFCRCCGLPQQWANSRQPATYKPGTAGCVAHRVSKEKVMAQIAAAGELLVCNCPSRK